MGLPSDDTLHDPVTGLPGRVLFTDRLERALERARRRPDHLFAVLLLKLERLPAVEDPHGAEAGRQLLRHVAGRLQAGLRGMDSVARLGAEEFALLLEDLESIDDATRAAARMVADLRAPVSLGGREVTATPSIGLTLGARQYERAADMVRDAGFALAVAKEEGGGRYRVFDRSLQERAQGPEPSRPTPG